MDPDWEAATLSEPWELWVSANMGVITVLLKRQFESITQSCRNESKPHQRHVKWWTQAATRALPFMAVSDDHQRWPGRCTLTEDTRTCFSWSQDSGWSSPAADWWPSSKNTSLFGRSTETEAPSASAPGWLWGGASPDSRSYGRKALNQMEKDFRVNVEKKQILYIPGYI